MKMISLVFALTRFAADDGKKYASVYLPEEKQAKDADRLGSVPMKVSSDYELMDTVRNIDFPAKCEIDFSIATAGGNKGGIHINSIVQSK